MRMAGSHPGKDHFLDGQAPGRRARPPDRTARRFRRRVVRRVRTCESTGSPPRGAERRGQTVKFHHQVWFRISDLKAQARILHRQVSSGSQRAVARVRRLPELADGDAHAVAQRTRRRHCLATLARELGFRS